MELDRGLEPLVEGLVLIKATKEECVFLRLELCCSGGAIHTCREI